MKEITSVRNPALLRYRGLREAGVRRETGFAAAEGFNLLREALLSETDLVQVFLSERARSRPDFEDLAARLEAGESAGHWESYAVPGEVLERGAHREPAGGARDLPAARVQPRGSSRAWWPGSAARPDIRSRQPRSDSEDRGGRRLRRGGRRAGDG